MTNYLPNQKGIAQILILTLLFTGVGLGVYLVNQRTNLKPKAFNPVSNPISNPVTPQPNGKKIVKNIKFVPPQNSDTPNAFGNAKIDLMEIKNETNLKFQVSAEAKKLIPGRTYELWVCLDDGSLRCGGNAANVMIANSAGNGIFKDVLLSLYDRDKFYKYYLVVIEQLPSGPVPELECGLLKSPCLKTASFKLPDSVLNPSVKRLKDKSNKKSGN